MQYRVSHLFFLSTVLAVVQVGNSERKQVSLVNTEFKKLRRQLQRLWRHIKIELHFRLSALRWFYVDHVYKIGQVYFHLIGTNGFLVRGKNCIQGACRTCSTILFPHSTNQIIDLWRCRRYCRRRFVQNSLIGSAAHASSENAHGSPSDTPWLSHLFCACDNFLARLQGSGWRRGARRTGFLLFLAYTKRISTNILEMCEVLCIFLLQMFWR